MVGPCEKVVVVAEQRCEALARCCAVCWVREEGDEVGRDVHAVLVAAEHERFGEEEEDAQVVAEALVVGRGGGRGEERRDERAGLLLQGGGVLWGAQPFVGEEGGGVEVAHAVGGGLGVCGLVDGGV